MLRKTVMGIGLIAVCLVGLGYLGSIHRSADTLSMGRPFFGVLCALSVLAARSYPTKVFLGLVALLAVVPTVGQHFGRAPGGDIRVYAKNMWYANPRPEEVANDIIAANVDVAMLQEVSRRNDRVLGLLKAEFPHQHICRFSSWSAIAVVSRHPFSGTPLCSDRRALAAAPIVLDGQVVWAVSVHLPWPWPKGDVANEEAAERLLARLEGPIVLAGDFNIFPWTGRIDRLASASGTRVAGPVAATYHLRGIPLPIDHALAPGGGRVERRPRLGSDHLGIVASLSLDPR